MGQLRLLCATGRPALDAGLAERAEVLASVRHPQAAAGAAVLHAPDAVVLALQVPDGVLAALRTLGFPVVALAGTGGGGAGGSADALARAAAFGVQHVLFDPVSADDVLDVLRGTAAGVAGRLAAGGEGGPFAGRAAPASDEPAPAEPPVAARVPGPDGSHGHAGHGERGGRAEQGGRRDRGDAAPGDRRERGGGPSERAGRAEHGSLPSPRRVRAVGPDGGPWTRVVAVRAALGALAGFAAVAVLVADPRLRACGALSGLAAGSVSGRRAAARAQTALWWALAQHLRAAAVGLRAGRDVPATAPAPGSRLRAEIRWRRLEAAVPLLRAHGGQPAVFAERLAAAVEQRWEEAAAADRAAVGRLHAASVLTLLTAALPAALHLLRPAFFALLVSGPGREVCAASIAAVGLGWVLLDRLDAGVFRRPAAAARLGEAAELAEGLAALAAAGLPLGGAEPAALPGTPCDAVRVAPLPVASVLARAEPWLLVAGGGLPAELLWLARGRAPAWGTGAGGPGPEAPRDAPPDVPPDDVGRLRGGVSAEAEAILAVLAQASGPPPALALEDLARRWRVERRRHLAHGPAAAGTAPAVLIACFLLPLAALVVWPALATILDLG